VTAVTVAELLYGIARLPDGRRENGLRQAALQMLKKEFAGQVLAFDEDAGVHFAAIVSQREPTGRPISMADATIAAICRLHAATLARRISKTSKSRRQWEWRDAFLVMPLSGCCDRGARWDSKVGDLKKTATRPVATQHFATAATQGPQKGVEDRRPNASSAQYGAPRH